jgi:glucose dehydrogenase
MKFIVVNGRTPRPQSFCSLCCEPIGESYLREIATRLSYCDQRCYADHSNAPVMALENRARASG